VSLKLDGHALAINQMAALMNARKMSPTKFLRLYADNPLRVHRERKVGWKYIGYQHALDTVWNMSFEALDQDASLCLGILSWLAPDSIPRALFEHSKSVSLPKSLDFCQDEFRYFLQAMFSEKR